MLRTGSLLLPEQHRIAGSDMRNREKVESLDAARMRYLYQAVHLGTIRAAAEAMDVAPSVVSRQIAKLESMLATPLVERHRRGVKATQGGLMLLDYYRQYVENEDAIFSKFREVKGLQRGNVSLVVVQGFIDDVMQNALLPFTTSYPLLTITLRAGGANEILTLIEEDEAHIGLTYFPAVHPVPPAIRSRAVMVQPLCAIVRPDHPLAQLRRPVLVQELAGYPMAAAGRSYGVRQVMQLMESSEKVRFNTICETDHLIALKSFVYAGLGITLLPAFFVIAEVIAGTLTTVPIDHSLTKTMHAHLVTRLGRELPIGADQLLRLMIARMQAFQDPDKFSAAEARK